MKSKFSFLLNSLILFSTVLPAQNFKIKFANCDCYYFGNTNKGYSWYGECKNGLANGFGILSRDTIPTVYIENNHINLYKTALFENGTLIPDSILANQNLLVKKHFDFNQFNKKYRNYAEYITYETKNKIYYCYRYGDMFGNHDPQKELAIYDKIKKTTRLFISEYNSGLRVWQKDETSDWKKFVFNNNCGYLYDCEFTQWITFMLSESINTNNPSIFFLLSSELCLNITDNYNGKDIYPKTLGWLYPPLISSAEKTCISDYLFNFFNEKTKTIWNSVPYLVDAVNRSFSNCKAEIILNKAKEYGITVRHTFKNDIIGKRYVPVIVRNYTTTVDEYYIGNQRVKITKDKTSNTGGYSENRLGYIAIYQLINESSNYLIIPITINGIAKFSENITELKGFIFPTEVYGKEFKSKPFKVNKTFLLAPNETVKEQLETGEEVPSNFYIELNDIKKVDALWVSKLEKALMGDIASAQSMLNDDLANPWFSNINAALEKASLKIFKSFIDISITPVDDLSFDSDFESEVKASINNRSDKKLNISFSTSFGKEGMVTLEPLKKTSVVYKIKGYGKEALKAYLTKINLDN